MTMTARLVFVLLLAATQAASSPFSAQIASLSEPGGYFDTDNLISNERSYLQVLPALDAAKVRGGAYIGVGPDQNFSYIAAIRPSVAYIVDIRRDNMLLHLLFKALFAQSRTRVEYLALLTGRPVPGDIERWRTAPVEKLVSYIDGTPARDVDALRRRFDAAVTAIGAPSMPGDRATIDRFHRRFIADGLSLRFQSAGRPPQDYNPNYRDLLVDRDGSGRQGNYLASEDAFQFVKALQQKDLVIPVTGNLAGPNAVVAVGKAIAARQERLSAFYVSNVEFYLFSEGSFQHFAENLGHIPRSPNSVVIRSIFGRYASGSRPGDASASRLQKIDELLREHAAGRIRQYGDVAYR